MKRPDPDDIGIPAGYVRLTTPGTRRAVARRGDAAAIGTVLAEGTLHEWAAREPGARPMQGRATAWAVRLPNGTPVVVRHSRHGGWLAPLTGDLFPPPTRAPRELATALRLGERGVPTPTVAAYATYPATAGLERADVATVEVPDAHDLGASLAIGTPFAALWNAVAPLLQALAAAGAHHPDLNVKNILLSGSASVSAWVLDVDRVRFVGPAAAARGNAARLTRSLVRWRERHGATITDADLARVRTMGAQP